MPVLISLLRGINVGGNNLIKMDALRELYRSLKLRDAETYVQSGNVVFRTDDRDAPLCAARIEKRIERDFGVRPSVIVRTVDEWRDVIARNPFDGRDGIEPGKLLVIFLDKEPTPAVRDAVRALKPATEEVHLSGREVYVYFPDGQGKSKFAGPLDRALRKSGTGRNWNSVTKLLEIAEKLEAKKA
jgi:uncharacterized protein (DUF1697 family)